MGVMLAEENLVLDDYQVWLEQCEAVRWPVL